MSRESVQFVELARQKEIEVIVSEGIDKYIAENSGNARDALKVALTRLAETNKRLIMLLDREVIILRELNDELITEAE